MPYNGTGTFQSLAPPTYPAVAGEVISAAYFNAIINDLITGLTTALCKDGQSTPSADLPMGGRKHTGVASAVASGQYLAYGQNVPTQAVDNSSQLIATTAYVLGQLASVAPLVAATAAAVGTSKRFARQDHVHRREVPVGAVVTGLWLTAPTGYLELKGQTVSRTTYAEMWAYVQALAATRTELLVSDATWSAADLSGRIAFSTGDGSTTFRLPDYRGLHPRFWEGTRSPAVDTSRVLGSYQADQLLAHTHPYQVAAGGSSASAYPILNNTLSGTAYTDSTGGSENRVKSVALMVCMAY